MVERIRTLLETRQLTPTQFADSIGIARPIVSHILSGRNKPSLEVVQRILAAMPDLSMPWLLNGTGPMLAGAPVASVTQQPAQVAATSVEPTAAAALPPPEVAPVAPAAPPKAPAVPTNRPRSTDTSSRPVRAVAPAALTSTQEPKRFAPTAAHASRRAALVTQPVGEASAAETPPAVTLAPPAPSVAAVLPALPATSAASTEGTPTTTALLAQTEKPIRRIVIFYHDGSFSDYRPE